MPADEDAHEPLLPPAVELVGAVETVVDRVEVDVLVEVEVDELDAVGVVAGIVLVPVPAEESSPRATAA
jgi:hypothetical protein